MQKILDFIVGIINKVTFFLPDCPFDSFLNAMAGNEYLKFLNWFISVSDMIVIGEAWLVAIAIFYLYQALLRWVKVVGS